jgi:peptide deformylase
MILPIVKYGHPVLRQKGVRVEKIDAEIKHLIDNMLETMLSAKGIGLAAQQVGRALLLVVLDIRGITDRPSTVRQDGKEIDPNSIMPLILLNPEIKPGGEHVIGSEGCLSFPEIFGEVSRPARVEVRAMNQKGEMLAIQCGGLLARAIQHEVDHLNGILYIDRMTRVEKDELQAELDELQAKTKAELKKRK